MQYSEGTVGRIFAIRLEHGDPMPASLEQLAAAKGVRAGLAIMVGGADDGSRFVVGPEDGETLPPVPMVSALRGVHEAAAVGTLFPDETGKPVLHMHSTFGRGDAALSGCIREGIVTWHILEVILLCEKNLITFNMVPDLFRIMTSSMDVQSLEDIPLLGVSRWPLDLFWNRALKRCEDVLGAAVGLVLASPVIAASALFVKLSSPGPVFYRQERCGEHGRPFTLLKLRTMRTDAEKDTGPVFTAENDPRATRVGAFLRRWNLDELPQLWNVLRGDMSLVGPRPERPHFVEQFKEDIGRYMWRHVSKPGITGWAQVNGLRGNTSIDERIRYDLYYLENWSLAFDLKILLRTVFAHENAY